MKFPNIKDEILRTALEELSEIAGKNVDAVARIDQIGKDAEKRDADVKSLRSEIDTLKADLKARENEIKEITQKARQQALNADPAKSKERALEILGMQMRSLFCRNHNVPVPAQFSGERALLEEYNKQRATLSSQSGDGLNLVPTITESMIIDALEEVSTLLSLTDFMPGLPAGNLDIPVLTGRPTLQHKRATIDTDMTQSDPALSLLSVTPNEGYVFFPVDNRLIQMSAVALGTLSVQLLRDSIIEGLVTDLLVADGTASYNSITGALSESTPAYLSVMPTGKKAFGDLAAEHLQAAKAKCLKRGRGPRGRFVMSEQILANITNIDRTGKVPLVTYGNDGMPRILGNQVEIDEGMPDIADSAVSKTFVLFGDLATYMVGLVGGIQIATSTEVLFKRNQTAFRGVINFDIKRKPVASLIGIRTAAA